MTLGRRRHTVRTNGVELSVIEAGAGPVVVLVHGFPDTALTWRRQSDSLAEAGYRVLAPDQRGYGLSTCPGRVEDYDILALTGDLVGLLDALGEHSAVFVGHDWGATIVWHLALLHPERVRAIVAISVPYAPRAPHAPLEIWRRRHAGQYFYIDYFQEPGVAEAELDADPHESVRRILGGLRDATDNPLVGPDDGRGYLDRLAPVPTLPDWLEGSELREMGDAFARTGFRGGLNWYRNIDRNWELTAHLDGAVVHTPSWYLEGRRDPVAELMPASDMATSVPGLVEHIQLDAGHWIPREQAGQLTAHIMSVLGSL